MASFYYTLISNFFPDSTILNTGLTLIKNHESPNRIPKTVTSFCDKAPYNVKGIVSRWRFKSEQAEFASIANSCRELIKHGIKPRNILILISSRDALLAGSPSVLKQKFDEVELEVEMPTGKHFKDEATGRFAFTVMRIACDVDLEDYVAHRTLLGLLKDVGPKAYNGIRDKVVNHSLNYMDFFYNPLPTGIFTPSENRTLKKVRAICEIISEWNPEDTIAEHIMEVASLLNDYTNQPEITMWEDFTSSLPDDMNINEFRAFMSTDNSEQQENILRDVYVRLELEIPEEGLLPQQVRIMTMHGAKGLNADVVIIPGLEEDILPGSKRAKYPGLIQEAARQLYVSITRSRHLLVLSYAESRMKYGSRDYGRGASRYCMHLDGKFVDRDQGLSQSEVESLLETKELFSKNMSERRLSLGK